MKITKVLLVLMLTMVIIFSSITYGKDTPLVWSGWSGEEAATKPLIQGMVSSWNEKHPEAPVTWVGWPWANTLEQLVIRSQGGESLDIAQVDFNMFTALASMDNVLLDVSKVFGKSWLKQNFEDAALQVGQVNGKQLALPWTLASIGMVYNPTLLQKVGVNEAPKTIQEFEDVLKKLKESDPNIIPYALSTKDATATSDFQPWLWAFGGSIFDKKGNVVINNAAGVKALTWYKSLLDKGYIKTDVSRFDSRQLYAKNLTGFYNDAIMAKGILKANGVAEQDLNKYIRPMLQPVLKAGNTPQSTMWGHLLVIFKKSKNPKATGEFAKHIIGEEQSMKYFQASGMLPVLKSVMSNEKVQSDDWSKQWLGITKYGKLTETAKYTKVNELNTIISEEIQAALVGKKAPQKALDDAAARIKTALK